MSASTTLTGTIRIEPPIPAAALIDSVFLPHDATPPGLTCPCESCIDESTPCVVLELDGQGSAVDVVPRWDHDDDSFEELVDELQALVTAYPDHAFHGLFELTHDDGDFWRVVVDGKTVVEHHPTITWPELPPGCLRR